MRVELYILVPYLDKKMNEIRTNGVKIRHPSRTIFLKTRGCIFTIKPRKLQFSVDDTAVIAKIKLISETSNCESDSQVLVKDDVRH